MRWKTTVIGLVAAMAFALGCKQQCFLYECDSTESYRRLGLTPQLENDPTPSIVPSVSSMVKPPNVNDSERPPRFISLAEAIALALENGDPGTQALNGTVNDDPAILTGRVRTASTASNIRVLSLNPAIVGPDVEAALSKFDARLEASMNWTTTDQPTQGLSSFQNGDQAVFQTSLLKPLPTGGVAGITFNTTYQNLSSPPQGFAFTNPAYTPKLTFQFEQPLLQGYGVEINQLRSTHPGSILTPFNTASRVEGILITRIRLDEERLDFERSVHAMLVNVETAYWNLYFSYWNLYSREQGLRFALEAWRVATERYQKGAESLAQPATARGQYEQFRGQRLAALDSVLESEHQLRRMIGLPPSDGTRLVPIDTPTVSPYEPDWTTALNEMLALRPGLGQVRQDLKFRQLDLISQKNLLLPDLRFTSSIAPNGLGNTLSGSSSSVIPTNPVLGATTPNPANAFHSLATGDFVNWGLGLRLDVALGFRDANAAVRSARLSLAQSYLTLRDLESRYTGFLEQQYRAIFATYEQITALRAQREAAAQQVRVRFDIYRLGARVGGGGGGGGGQQPIEFLLDAQRLWADALRDEYQAIVNYNNALARYEYAKGTIMQHDNIVIAEGGLPQCAQVRAVEHERERSHALVLKERAKPITAPCCRVEGGTLTGVPELPPSEAPSLPALFEGQSNLEKIPERLPSNPAELPKPSSDGTTPGDVSKSNTIGPKPETPVAGPVSFAVPPSADHNPIIGTPTAVLPAPVAEQPKEPGAYQIPSMSSSPLAVEGAAKTADAPATVAKTSTPPAASTLNSTQWNHPERLQRTHWRESIGGSTGDTPSSN